MKTIIILRLGKEEFIPLSPPKIGRKNVKIRAISLKSRSIVDVNVPLTFEDLELRNPKNEYEHKALENIIVKVKDDLEAEIGARKMINKVLDDVFDLMKLSPSEIKEMRNSPIFKGII